MKKYIKALLIIIAVFAFSTIRAKVNNDLSDSGQNSIHFTKTLYQKVNLAAVIDLVNVKSSFKPVLGTGEVEDMQGKSKDTVFAKSAMPSPSFHEDEPYSGSNFKTRTADMPYVFNQFDGGNGYPSHPPDNTLAVSNSGCIVSVMNQNYRFFRPNDSSSSNNISFFDALNGTFPYITSSYSDPRVVYDAENDRFIMVVLNGSSSASSKIILLFSKSGNPAKGWNAYAVSGDLFLKNEWSDFPQIALSKNDLFVTVNMFNDSNKEKGPGILQLSKGDGYHGAGITYIAYSLDSTGIGKGRSFTPAPHGLGKDYGDSMYFVGISFSNKDSFLSLIKISGAVSEGNSRFALSETIPYTLSVYHSPHTSNQKQDTTSFTLNMDDGRIQQAFYLNHVIHFVFSTRDQNTGFGDIVYARLNVNTKSFENTELGLFDFDYAYPSIASIAENDTDKSVLIGYCRSGEFIFPEADVVECDNDFNFSPSVTIAAGLSPIMQRGETSGELRWGDYTGMARQYGSKYCYCAGSYGGYGSYQTTIAQISLANNTGIDGPINPAKTPVSVYPNPVIDIFSIDFQLEQRANLDISVYDMQGRQIELLYKSMTNRGLLHFSFNKSALKPGVYSLVIAGDNNVKRISKQIVVE